MVALPGQLFYSTQIPACLWFLARNRKGGKLRDRRGEELFIDARKLGRMVDRTHRELTYKDITRIADTYHAWRSGEDAGEYVIIHLTQLPGRVVCSGVVGNSIQGHSMDLLRFSEFIGLVGVPDDVCQWSKWTRNTRRRTATGAGPGTGPGEVNGTLV